MENSPTSKLLLSILDRAELRVLGDERHSNFRLKAATDYTFLLTITIDNNFYIDNKNGCRHTFENRSCQLAAKKLPTTSLTH